MGEGQGPRKNPAMTAAIPVLYSFRRCPYAMRARLALLASSTECELREVTLAHKPPTLLLASPKGTVPVMVLPDGAVLEQSLDIMRWALRRNDPEGWLPPSAQAMGQALALIAQCDGEFKHHLDRYKYPNRHALPDGLQDRTLGNSYLAQLNHLLQTQRHLAGPAWGLADAAIAPFVRQWAHTDPPWFASQPWPALQQWLSAFENSAEFARAMVKLPPWQPGALAVQFGTH
jgi:glutathione S-transferase